MDVRSSSQNWQWRASHWLGLASFVPLGWTHKSGPSESLGSIQPHADPSASQQRKMHCRLISAFPWALWAMGFSVDSTQSWPLSTEPGKRRKQKTLLGCELLRSSVYLTLFQHPCRASHSLEPSATSEFAKDVQGAWETGTSDQDHTHWACTAASAASMPPVPFQPRGTQWP